MKNFNALSEEDLNKASGGAIFHNKSTGEYMVVGGKSRSDAKNPSTDEVWEKIIANTRSLGIAKKIAQLFEVNDNVIEF